MTTTLSEGVKVPDVGSVNWAGDLEVNWNLLNGALANLSGNVKLDRDNTWTGEQSFTLPIVGSITGTASKAIADEDGNSIKSSYGKLAYVNTWSTAQVFLNALRFNNTSYVSGTPSENIFYTVLQWGGYVNNTWSAPFTINNAIRTNGYSDTSFRTYSQTSNTLTGFMHETNADASDIAFRPIANGTHKLGSSSYQWSSVYAQSYYYNGTQWGLDKENVWSENNRFVKNVNPESVTSIADTTLAFNGLFNTIFLNTRGSSNRRSYGSFLFVGYGSASGADNYGQIQLLRSTDKRGDTNEGYVPDTSFKMWRVAPHSLIMDAMETVRVTNDGTENSLKPITTGVTDLGTSTNQWKSVYSQTYFYNGTAWGLDKANTWTGANTFTSTITTKTNVDRTVAPASDTTYGTVICRDKNGSAMFRMQGTIKTDLSNVWDMMMVASNNSYITFFRYSINTATSDRELKFKADSVIPDDNSASNLGTSTNKWKTLNGIDPGALSLPDIAQYVDLTANIPAASLDGSVDINLSSYITISGWLSIVVPDTNTDDFVFVQNGSSLNNRFFMSGARGNGFISLMMPINSAGGVNAKIKASSVTFCKFYPCLGNV